MLSSTVYNERKNLDFSWLKQIKQTKRLMNENLTNGIKKYKKYLMENRNGGGVMSSQTECFHILLMCL